METESRQNRFGSYSFGVPATTVIGTLSGSLGGPIAAIIGAVVGPGWGIGLGLISPWLARRMPKLTRRRLSVAAFIATTLFGGSLFAMLLYVASPTPQNILNLMRPPLRRLHLFSHLQFADGVAGHSCRASGHTSISFRKSSSSWRCGLASQSSRDSRAM